MIIRWGQRKPGKGWCRKASRLEGSTEKGWVGQSTWCSGVREHQTEDRSLDCTPRRCLLTLTRALSEVGCRPKLPRGGSRQAWKQKPEPGRVGSVWRAALCQQEQEWQARSEADFQVRPCSILWCPQGPQAPGARPKGHVRPSVSVWESRSRPQACYSAIWFSRASTPNPWTSAVPAMHTQWKWREKQHLLRVSRGPRKVRNNRVEREEGVWDARAGRRGLAGRMSKVSIA